MPRKHTPSPENPGSDLAGSGDENRLRSIEADRLAYRLAELARLLGISRRTLERERSAGRFPRPDLTIGKAPLWKPETIRRWIDGGGR